MRGDVENPFCQAAIFMCQADPSVPLPPTPSAEQRVQQDGLMPRHSRTEPSPSPFLQVWSLQSHANAPAQAELLAKGMRSVCACWGTERISFHPTLSISCCLLSKSPPYPQAQKKQCSLSPGFRIIP